MIDKIAQAAANKAAEEGGLPALESGPFYELFKFTVGSLAVHNLVEAREIGEKFRALIRADRASRQVANKAEVEEELRDYWMDKGFLQWVHDRLRFVHKENENVDYMHKLRSIIASFPDDRKTPNVASIATPPATTGASTAPADPSMPRDMTQAVEWIIGLRARVDSLLDVIEAEREVAAQAGQVASVPSAVAVPEGWTIKQDGDGVHIEDSNGRWCVYTRDTPAHRLACEFFEDLIAADLSPAKESK